MALKKRQDLEAREAVDVSRMAKKGAGSLVYVAAILAVVVMVLGISMNFRTRWDFSVTQSNRLSPQTQKVLQELTEDVLLYALYNKQAETIREQYWLLLQQYRAETDRIHVEFIDPIGQPGKVRDLGIDTQAEDLRQEGITLVIRGEKRMTFRGTEEGDITNAILEVGRTSPRVVGILRGYGERDPASDAGGGFARARDALLAEYYEVRNVQAVDGIPEDVSMLILPGPTLPMPASDFKALASWLDAGGRLMVLVDPGNGGIVNELLVPWGLQVGEGQIVDPRQNINGHPPFLRITNYSDNPVVRAFDSRLPTSMALTAPISHFETGEGSLFHEELAQSSGHSMVVTEEGRETGPFDVAAASWRRLAGEEPEETGAETRVVLVGDADFASNAYLQDFANRNLFLNCVGWLGREEELLSIRKLVLADQAIELEDHEKSVIYLILAAAPVLLLATGIVVAWRRRGS